MSNGINVTFGGKKLQMLLLPSSLFFNDSGNPTCQFLTRMKEKYFCVNNQPDILDNIIYPIIALQYGLAMISLQWWIWSSMFKIGDGEIAMLINKTF